MKEDSFLKLIYTVFVGIFIALFVGVGINTFYPGPKNPDYPVELVATEPGKSLSAEEIQIQNEFDTKVRDYEEQIKPYSRNVSIITLLSAVILLAISIFFGSRIKIIANGIMLGGLFTLIYSVGRGFASEDNRYVFFVICIGLVAIIYLGYRQFIPALENKEISTTSKKKK